MCGQNAERKNFEEQPFPDPSKSIGRKCGTVGRVPRITAFNFSTCLLFGNEIETEIGWLCFNQFLIFVFGRGYDVCSYLVSSGVLAGCLIWFVEKKRGYVGGPRQSFDRFMIMKGTGEQTTYYIFPTAFLSWTNPFNTARRVHVVDITYGTNNEVLGTPYIAWSVRMSKLAGR